MCDPCPKSWLYFEPTDSCYKNFTLAGETHQDRYEAYCVRHGAHLASIHSDDEVDFLRKNYGNEERWKGFWMGMVMDSFNRWSHLDGSVVDYFNWNTLQPDNMYSREFCSHQYNTGKWNDIRCNSFEIKDGVCKMPAFAIP
ncbi:Collectin-12 [Toxocara canis]|uniref:Collectin-12 n=1 Tax=Toxocara canis TaxID=6265 RepID=A0A0B2V200_TOXCA|nr:Collectin-12 [Toxocara canis]